MSIFVLSPHNEAPRNHLQNYKPLVLAMDLIKSVTVRTEVHGFGAAAVAAELLKLGCCQTEWLYLPYVSVGKATLSEVLRRWRNREAAGANSLISYIGYDIRHHSVIDVVLRLLRELQKILTSTVISHRAGRRLSVYCKISNNTARSSELYW